MKKIAVFGKSSYLGTSFAEYIADRDGYSIEKIDSRNDKWKEIDFGQYDVVYFTAGIAHVNMKTTDPELYYSVNRDLPIAVAKKAKEQGLRQFVFLSSIYVFGLEGTVGKECNITENTPKGTRFAYGVSKAQADEKLLELNDDKFHVVILRPPMIYGKNSKGNFPRLDSLASKVGVFPNFKNERSMIYVKNLDEFVKKCIDENVNGVFYPQNKDYVSTSELYYLLREVKGKKTWKTKLFNPLIKILGNKIGVLRKLFGNMTVDKKLSETFGFEYCLYDLKGSLEDILN